MGKKRYRGHYCKVCDEIKSNEKFSGKGHKNHICKSCSKLSKSDRSELMLLRKIQDIEASGFFLSKANMDKLKSYSKNSKYPKVKKYARQVLDDYNERINQYNQDKEIEEIQGLLEDEIYELEIYLEDGEELPF
ncbi:hypothetical protein [Wukongibacter sp. M2B1]|uniref:hypothetical protein n=1 Tax=Wukongibacter sp. M2B1 TaxID=3088895 RepID=UPI003D7B53D8